MVNLKQMRVSLKTSDFTGKYTLRLDYENVNGSRISESNVFTFGIITVNFRNEITRSFLPVESSHSQILFSIIHRFCITCNSLILQHHISNTRQSCAKPVNKPVYTHKGSTNVQDHRHGAVSQTV